MPIFVPFVFKFCPDVIVLWNFPFYSMHGIIKSTTKNCMVLKYEKIGWFYKIKSNC
jgi:hypothetical protein